MPKTGTHAVRFALRAHLGETDEEQVQLFVQKAMPYPEIARVRHGHIRWDEIRAAAPAAVWDGYFKFAFVRNPWARFISYCAFVTREGDRFAAAPRTVMRNVLADPSHRARIVFRPQHEFLCNADGNVMVDFVGRHETMQASYDEIAARIGLPATPLARVNATDHGPWRDYYDAALRDAVAEIYARDIDVFGYSFDA